MTAQRRTPTALTRAAYAKGAGVRQTPKGSGSRRSRLRIRKATLLTAACGTPTKRKPGTNEQKDSRGLCRRCDIHHEDVNLRASDLRNAVDEHLAKLLRGPGASQTLGMMW